MGPIRRISIASDPCSVVFIQRPHCADQTTKDWNNSDRAKNLLANRNITKVGIENLKDALYLKQDYDLDVQGTFDLRFLARDTGHQPYGLKRLALDILGIDIGQDVEIMAFGWGKDSFSDKQVTYAVKAVKASFDIYQKLIREYVKNRQDMNFS